SSTRRRGAAGARAAAAACAPRQLVPTACGECARTFGPACSRRRQQDTLRQPHPSAGGAAIWEDVSACELPPSRYLRGVRSWSFETDPLAGSAALPRCPRATSEGARLTMAAQLHAREARLQGLPRAKAQAFAREPLGHVDLDHV